MMPDQAFFAALERAFAGEQNVLDYVHDKVGLSVTVVMRIVPQAPREYLGEGPAGRVHQRLSGAGGRPEGLQGPAAGILPMLRLTDHIEAEEVRKIYTLNMVHATSAYLGLPRRHTYVKEAAADPVLEARC